MRSDVITVPHKATKMARKLKKKKKGVYRVERRCEADVGEDRMRGVSDTGREPARELASFHLSCEELARL